MNVWLFALLMCGLLIALIFVLFWHPQRSQTRTSPSTGRRRPRVIDREDDQYWRAGLFYNNPDDPAVLVPKRFGLGWTVNFGHPYGRLFMLGILLIPPVILILTILISGTAPIGCHPSGCYPLP